VGKLLESIGDFAVESIGKSVHYRRNDRTVARIDFRKSKIEKIIIYIIDDDSAKSFIDTYDIPAYSYYCMNLSQHICDETKFNINELKNMNSRVLHYDNFIGDYARNIYDMINGGWYIAVVIMDRFNEFDKNCISELIPYVDFILHDKIKYSLEGNAITSSAYESLDHELIKRLYIKNDIPIRRSIPCKSAAK
jgi:hypothetical protein